ncbi:hypothetical protein DRE_06411 [Drechslerella stenobrocha 248]|uniref:Uncharacterized protein n=1 Tax=Drechslerella stenobrocha 248 TaxID=1043628 RepID=W7HXW9_9PEZI|nr:hypothetical protein DRE_06411 [Drechslerella stenobrocha 248]
MTASPETRYEIDANFNCEVHLSEGPNKHIYCVSKSALRLASSVLAKMKKKTPEDLDLKRIFRLACLCDKYDCVDVAKPLINEIGEGLWQANRDDFWTPFSTYDGSRLQPEDGEDARASATDRESSIYTIGGEVDVFASDKPAVANMLLYVSFIFDLEQIFQRAYYRYLMIWQPKKQAGDSDSVVNGPICLPHRLYKHFMAEWEEKRTAIVRVVNTQIQRYTYGLLYGKDVKCLRHGDCTLCDIALYGSFIRRLCYMGLFPVQEKSDALSLLELSGRVKTIKIGHYWDTRASSTPMFPHNECMSRLMRDLRVAVAAVVNGRSELKLQDFKTECGVKRKFVMFEEGGEEGEKAGPEEKDEEGSESQGW